MNHAANCKFCQRNLVLDIDPEYVELGDPFKLLKYATCNTCADLRVRKRKLEDTIGNCCNRISQKSKKDSGSDLMEVLDKATRKYAEVIATLHELDRFTWDDAFPKLLFDKPNQWGQILTIYIRNCITDHKRTKQYQTA